jgi:hypothetical protein
LTIARYILNGTFRMNALGNLAITGPHSPVCRY